MSTPGIPGSRNLVTRPAARLGSSAPLRSGLIPPCQDETRHLSGIDITCTQDHPLELDLIDVILIRDARVSLFTSLTWTSACDEVVCGSAVGRMKSDSALMPWDIGGADLRSSL